MRKKISSIFIFVLLLIFSINNVEAKEVSNVDESLFIEESAKDNRLEKEEEVDLEDPSIEIEDPVDPKEPTDPEEPIEPENPIDPEEPIEPENPIDPEEPVDPENPIDPDEPIDPEDPSLEGWILNEDGQWNYYKDGNKVIDKWIWAEVDLDEDGEVDKSNWKYFNAQGVSQTTFYINEGNVWLSQAGPNSEYFRGWWESESGLKYYFRESSGARVKGWQKIDGEWRYFRYSGTLANSWQYVDGGWRFFKDDGTQLVDQWAWLPIDLNNDNEVDTHNWKYFDMEGKNKTTFYINDGTVWLSQAGPYKEYYRGWWTNESGMTYYFRQSSGARVSGWQKIEDEWRYFRESGTLATGWQMLDGGWRYFKEDGIQVKDKWVWLEIDPNNDGRYEKNNWKYFDENGINQTIFYIDGDNVWLSNVGPYQEYHRGWWTNEAGMRYYFRESSGARVEGWQYIGGAWRYFRESGTLTTGWQKIGDKRYYFKSSGKAATGLQTINGNKYIFNSGSRPYMLTDKKNYEHNGRIYNIASNGVAKELDRFGWTYSNGMLYRFNRYGSMIESTYVGSRFILVDLNLQKMYLYNYGSNKVTTNIISGKPSTPTITGHFVVQHKETSKYLRGRYYVDYWVQFSGDYGIHDASWQTSSYYQDIYAYTYVGSHGCVNTPTNSMRTIYNTIRLGDPVIVFK